MNAHPDDQKRLLEIAETDVQLARANRSLRELPQRAALEENRLASLELAPKRLAATEAREEIAAEIERAEADVALVKARITRDEALEAGSSSVKDVQAIEHELVSLKERLAMLEDAELIVMQRLEDADAELAQIDAEQTALSNDRARLEADLAEAEAANAAEVSEIQATRSTLAATVPADLMSTYEQIRERAGVGAALLRAGTCGGCRIELPHADMERVRSASADAVVNCPECNTILVRTEESGLS